tara:strand:- start:167 stop:340 length:174 start_codon:yes stop_codon:yes gene_type:complete
MIEVISKQNIEQKALNDRLTELSSAIDNDPQNETLRKKFMNVKFELYKKDIATKPTF